MARAKRGRRRKVEENNHFLKYLIISFNYLLLINV
jgi:hypothetical protein